MVANQTDKARNTKSQLLAAARKAFETEGYDATSVSTIARDAGVSRGTFYVYFESKEDVFRLIISEVQDAIFAAQKYHLDLPSEEVIRVSLRSFLEFYRENSRMMATFEQVATFDPEIRRFRREMRRGTAVRTAAFLAKMQQNGEADPSLDCTYASYALGAMAERFAYIWFVLEETFDLDAAVDVLTRLWVGALSSLPTDQRDATARPPSASRQRRASARTNGD